MRPLRSVGYRTDLFVCAFDGVVEERERYVVIRTSSNPNFWWGNYLLYPEPPQPSDAATWLADRARELSGVQATRLAWDRPDGAQGELQPFLDHGFALDDGTVLTARRGELRGSKVAPAHLRAARDRVAGDGRRRDVPRREGLRGGRLPAHRAPPLRHREAREGLIGSLAPRDPVPPCRASARDAAWVRRGKRRPWLTRPWGGPWASGTSGCRSSRRTAGGTPQPSRTAGWSRRA